MLGDYFLHERYFRTLVPLTVHSRLRWCSGVIKISYISYFTWHGRRTFGDWTLMITSCVDRSMYGIESIWASTRCSPEVSSTELYLQETKDISLLASLVDQPRDAEGKCGRFGDIFRRCQKRRIPCTGDPSAHKSTISNLRNPKTQARACGPARSGQAPC